MGFVVGEIDPPQGADQIEWVLLTDQPLSDFAAARVLVDYYSRRWIIEEWHPVEKTGCGLEAAQLKMADALKRLAALTAVVAVRLLQLRDAAQSAVPSDDAATLAQLVLETWIHVVARSAKCKPSELTPKLFWLTLAKRGGYLARKSDGPPGWQTIWRGWYDLMLLVAGYEMAIELQSNNCG
ncbi:MAG TPA: hypothetical protein VNT79_13190 [Phycisphaerae bacterium]|nr:hypothetical protein [Phycisphaerae bacterium]